MKKLRKIKFVLKKLYYNIRGWDYMQSKIHKYMYIVDNEYDRFTTKDLDDMFDVMDAIVFRLRIEGDKALADELVSEVSKILRE